MSVSISVLRRWISSGHRVRPFSAMTGSASPWFTRRSVSHPSACLLKADVSVAQLITSGLIRPHYCNPISALNLPHKHGRTRSNGSLMFVSGCHSCRLHFFLCLSDWSSVPWSCPEIPRPWPGPLRSCLHPTTVLLLLWLAKGEEELTDHFLCQQIPHRAKVWSFP